MTRQARPYKPLSHREFAETYVTMPPTGPRGGLRFRSSWQPVIGLLWSELDKELWREVVVTGPVQSSKSFGALVIPTLRDVIELRISPIVGVPEADMFSDKWDKDFKPVLESSPLLCNLIPRCGSGAKGGRVKDRVTLGGRGDIKVMSRGGQATAKAGYTSSRLRITEAAGFSNASQSSGDEEADAYRQLVARLGAFGLTDPRRLVVVEGTGTVAEHLPWRLRGRDDDDVVISSRSQIVAPCPHCGEWISPERDHLIGWQDAQSMLQALEQAAFVCPKCGMAINDDQRRTAMADCRLLHHGQTISKDGTVDGPAPETLRLWFRWSAFHNLLLNAGDTAVKEWEAAQIEEGTLDRENAERDLCQKSWAIPYTSSLADNEPLNPQVVRKRRTEFPRGILPPDTRFVTVGRDVGKWTGYWAALAFCESGAITIPAYGCFDIMRDDSEELSTRIFHALREHDERLLEGFQVYQSAKIMVPERVWTDMNYMPDDVAAATRAAGSGMRKRFQCGRGAGRSVPHSNGGYHHPSKVTAQMPLIGRQWYREWNYKRGVPETTFNSDFWTLYMHERLRTKPGRKGSLSFFAADTKNEHAKLSHHLCADQLSKQWDPKRGGLVEKWAQTGENHWGDCVKNALAAGDELGFSLRDIVEPTPDSEQLEQAEQAESDELQNLAGEQDNWYARMLGHVA